MMERINLAISRYQQRVRATVKSVNANRKLHTINFKMSCFCFMSTPVHHHVPIIPCGSLQHTEVRTYYKEEKEEEEDWNVVDLFFNYIKHFAIDKLSHFFGL